MEPLRVAPDGSPIEVYLRIPAGEAPALIHSAIPDEATILDLGCGTGRIGGELVRLGHAVTGVDQSSEMLAHARQRGLQVIQGDIESLDLGLTFDAVILASHLVNIADAGLRRGFLMACRRHVRDAGVVLVERHPAEWVRSASRSVAQVGDVEVEVHHIHHDGEEMEAAVTYRVGTAEATQHFRALALDDAGLAREAGAADLTLDRVLDTSGEWVLLRPRP